MTSSTKHTLAVALALLAVSGLLCAHASAARLSRVIQQKTLVAKAQVQTWTSRSIRGTVYGHVYGSDGREIEQRYAGPCKANYPARAKGLSISLVVLDCHSQSKANRYKVRFLSISGPQRFTIRLTRSPQG